MVVAIIILAVALILMIIKYIFYRRQIKDICRQLSFVQKHDTNILFSSSVDAKEILELEALIGRMKETAQNDRASFIRKDRQLKEALANVSHDIRTPLTSLKGYFQLLRKEDNIEKQMKYAEIMEERMDNLTELLEELFDFTRLQNDEYRVELTECNLTKAVLDSLFSFFDVIKQRNIEPEMDIYEDPIYMNGNELAIKRIISNVIKNALVHGNGELKFHYSVDKEKGYAAFSCVNSVEHPEDIDITQVFDRFYKADKARSKTSTGLGLAISYNLVKRLGGTIEADMDGNMFGIYIQFPIIDK